MPLSRSGAGSDRDRCGDRGGQARLQQPGFSIPHFAGYPAVLVRLGVIEPDELRDLLRDAWLARVPKKLARAYLDANP